MSTPAATIGRTATGTATATATAAAWSPSVSATARHPWALLAALAALASALRGLGANSGLWFDEMYALVVSSRTPLGEVLTSYKGDVQHPLYSVLAHLMIVLFGESPWSVRLPAIAFGVASAPMLYLLATTMISRREAILAALFLTVSYHHIWFSQNARGYTALLFFTLLCTDLLCRGLRERRSGWFLGYAAAAALGAYTHLTMVFVVLGHAAACLALAVPALRRGEHLKDWFWPAAAFPLAGLGTLALYAPMFGDVLHFFLHSRSNLQGVSTPRWAVLEAIEGLNLGLGSGLALVLAVGLIGCGLASIYRRDRTALLLLVLPGLATLVGVVGTRGTFYPRYLFPVFGSAVLIVIRGAMVAGAGLARLMGPCFRQWAETAPALGTALVLVLTAATASSLGFCYAYPKQDFEGALRYVEAVRREGEPIITAGAARWPYRHYFERAWPEVHDVAGLDAACAGPGRAWLLYTFPEYLRHESPDLMAEIERRFSIAKVFPGTLNHGAVYVCVREPGSP